MAGQFQSAIDHLNEEGGANPLRLGITIEDSQSSPASGVSAFRKLTLGANGWRLRR